MQHFLVQYRSLLVLVVGLLSVLSLVLVFGLSVSLSGLKRRFKKWKGVHSTADLDGVYAQTLEEVDRLRQDLAVAREEIEGLRRAVRTKVSSAQLLRYNAFQDLGSDLSFSFALLDDEQNGVVVSSIYGRDESRTYAKPVHAGVSTYALTEEEMQVITDVIRNHGTHSEISTRRQRHPIHS